MSKSLKHAIEYSNSPETKARTRSMSQHERFVETARELGCDEDPEAFKQAVRKLAKAPPLTPRKRKDKDRGEP